MERYRLLAGIIAAHPEHKVIGRTRLQKTVKLLQCLGAPLNYGYTIHFYGPYSEDLQADIGLLENLGLIEEKPPLTNDDTKCYILEAKESAVNLMKSKELDLYRDKINMMSDTDVTILELAATYETFREMGSNHKEALNRLRVKKGAKCSPERLEKVWSFLKSLKLSVN